MGNPFNLWHETSWFAVQSKLRQERLAAARVAKLDLEVFLPRLRDKSSIGRGDGDMGKALFPGYFFTRFRPLDFLEAVRYTHGVLRVVGSCRFPIPVAPEIVSGIRAQVQPDGFVQLKTRGLKPGDKVIVEQGPFQGWIGKIHREHDDSKRVTILLDAIQQARLSVEKGWVELIPLGSV
jgi:transcriptional antiterminator RfaH